MSSVSVTRSSNGAAAVAEGSFALTPQLLQEGLTFAGLNANDTVKLLGLTGNDIFSMTGAALVWNVLPVTAGLAATVTMSTYSELPLPQKRT